MLGASHCVNSLLDAKKSVLFVTNNAGSSRAELRNKLASMLSCPALTYGQMISSSYSCAMYLAKQLKSRRPQQERIANGDGSSQEGDIGMHKSSVYVIGSPGLADEIANFGFHVKRTPLMASDSEYRPGMTRAELEFHDFVHQYGLSIDAVVVGLDTDFNYRKLCVATELLHRSPHAILVSTNQDAYDLVGIDRRRLPGNGSIVRAIEMSSQRTAIDVGKPSHVLADLLQLEYGLIPSRTMIVGDRLDTDIRFGLNGGMCAALVLTGCTTATRVIQLMDVQRDALESSRIVGKGDPLPSIVFPHVGLIAL